MQKDMAGLIEHQNCANCISEQLHAKRILIRRCVCGNGQETAFVASSFLELQVRPHQLDIRCIIFVVDSADPGRLRVGKLIRLRLAAQNS